MLECRHRQLGLLIVVAGEDCEIGRVERYVDPALSGRPPERLTAFLDVRGFRWIDCHDAEQSVISFLRIGEDGELLVFACNFTPVPRKDYRLGVPEAGTWVELVNSDAEDYGGSGITNPEPLVSAALRCHEMDQSICLSLPPLGMLALRLESEES